MTKKKLSDAISPILRLPYMRLADERGSGRTTDQLRTLRVNKDLFIHCEERTFMENLFRKTRPDLDPMKVLWRLYSDAPWEVERIKSRGLVGIVVDHRAWETYQASIRIPLLTLNRVSWP